MTNDHKSKPYGLKVFILIIKKNKNNKKKKLKNKNKNKSPRLVRQGLPEAFLEPLQAFFLPFA